MSDLISRCDLFNRLATIPAPAEANDFKAKIYEIIQSMEAADVLYVCDRNRCECCNPDCDLTRDEHHAATTETAILADGVVNTIRGWIPCNKKMPEPGSWAIWCSVKGIIQVARWKEDAIDHFFPDQGFFQLEDAVAWMPLPKPWKGADDEMR